MCGSPTYKVILINIDQKRVMGGSQSSIDIKGRVSKFMKVKFNPNSHKVVSLVFTDCVELYEFKECMEVTENGVQEGILCQLNRRLEVSKLEATVWDELGNVRYELFSCTWRQIDEFGCGARKQARKSAS